MIQEDSLYTATQYKAVSQQDSTYHITDVYVEKGILCKRPLESILYEFPKLELSSSNINTKNYSRFFVEKGKTQMIENKRNENKLIPLWVHLTLAFWLLVLVFVRQSYSFRLRQIFVAVFKPKQVKQLLREGNILSQGFPILLLILSAFTISLFAFIAISRKFPDSAYFSLGEGFLIFFGSVLAFHLMKFLVIRFLGLLFETENASLLHLIDHFLFLISQGLILFPLLILFMYSELSLFLYVGILIFFSLWLFRLQRAIVIGLSVTNFSPFYLFLYLCTLEVIPFLLLYKLGLQFV